MAFDTLNFKSLSNLSTLQNTINQVTSVSSSLSAQGVNGITSSLFSSGVSLSSIKSFASSKLDNLLNSTDFVSNGLDWTSERIGATQLYLSRSESAERGVDPSTVRSATQQLPIIYPVNLSGTEYMSIEFSKYNRPSAVKRPIFETNSSIHLPLPKQLQEIFSIGIDAVDTGLIGALANSVESTADLLKTLFGGKAEPSIGSYKDYINDALGVGFYNIMDAGTALESTLGFKGATQTASQALGAIPNPHISVFFEGVKIRPGFEFSWIFTPRNYNDTQVIKSLIYLLKRKVLPRTSTGSQNIMMYPDLVKITMKGPWSRTNTPLMPTYKYGFIESLAIDYAPNGLSFFNDQESAPTFIIISFKFSEVEVFTATDFGADQVDVVSEIGAGIESISNFITDKIGQGTQ